MKFEYFVEQPSIDILRGVQVRHDTSLTYMTENVKQQLSGLTLVTEMKERGSNGTNTYHSESRITIQLNEGDILLFDESRGFYLPGYPKTTIAQAIEDITALSAIDFAEEEIPEGGNVNVSD